MNLTTQHINQNNEIIDFHNLSIINPSEYNFSDLDPSQENGYSLFYNGVFLFHVTYNKIKKKFDDYLTIKISQKLTNRDSEILDYKFEILNESDPFIHFNLLMNKEVFIRYKSSFNLNCTFENFREFIVNTFQDFAKEPNLLKNKNYLIKHYFYTSFCANFIVNDNGMANLELSKKFGFKYMNIFNLSVVASNEETVKKSIIFRFNSMKTKRNIIDKKIKELFIILKEKNPDLNLYIQKNISFAPNYT